jgi:hypothetical protein
MYHTAVYQAAAAGAGLSNVDFAAAVDSVFTQRNSHYTFTVPLKLARTFPVGLSLTIGRYQCPTWNAIGEFDILNVARSAAVPTNPSFDDYLDYPPDLPVNEEFQVQFSNNLGAATEVESAALQIISKDWSPQLPRGLFRMVAKATFTLNPTANVWSGPQVIALSSNLRNGVYSVVGMQIQGSGILAGRLVFPTQRAYMGRFFRPGNIAQAAVGNQIPQRQGRSWADLGECGRFHTFELPQVEVFGLTAGSITYAVFLDLIYLGTDLSLLTSWAAGGSDQSTI